MCSVPTCYRHHWRSVRGLEACGLLVQRGLIGVTLAVLFT